MSDAVATWDAQAPRYGRQADREARALAAALRVAAVRAADDVVDLATGTGLVLRGLAALPSPPRSAVGVDRSPGMLARIGPLPAGWTARRADAAATGLPADSADLVVCAYLLHLQAPARRAAVLAEAGRLLRPGPRSRLVVVTVWVDDRRPAGRLLGGALAAAARWRPARLGGLAPLDPTAELERCGWRPERRVQLPHGGYPSLVVRARPT